MLTKRKQDILRVIIGEYVATAAPVGSKAIAQKYALKVSPATIRNEMVSLEQEGYIAQPHHSAGRVPLQKGYRHYVEALMGEDELPQDVQFRIRHQFHQVSSELEQWLDLGAAVLSYLVQNVAIVTWPKAREPRLKHLELVSLHEFLALLVLVLQEARLRQQMIALDEATSQEELNAIAAKLNTAFNGLTGAQIGAMDLELSPAEEQVVAALVQIMESEKAYELEEPNVTGLHYLLGQPEFTSTDKAAGIAEVFEERGSLRLLLPSSPTEQELRVVIGTENKEEMMHDCTLILSCYGLTGEVSGIVGIVGPIRMDYERNVSAVRFLSRTMSELVASIYC